MAIFPGVRPWRCTLLTCVIAGFCSAARVFVERVQSRHNRWGLTADSHLHVAGDLSTNRPVSNDNDGL